MSKQNVVNDTGGAPRAGNISANFRKNWKKNPNGTLRGLGETEKNLSIKSVALFLLLKLLKSYLASQEQERVNADSSCQPSLTA